MTISKSITYTLAALVASMVPAQIGSAQEVADTVKAATETAVEAVKETAVEAVAKTDENAEKVTVMLDEEGKLNGNVFLKLDDDQKKPVDANVTLSHDGMVVGTLTADEEGAFAFQSLDPGSYEMFGTSDSYIGGQSVDVVPYSSGSGCSSCDLGLSNGYTSEAAYDNYAAAPCGSCNSCGGGCGSGGGGGLLGGGGLGGGGLGRKLLIGGLIGGVVAIAVDDDDDNSPDE